MDDNNYVNDKYQGIAFNNIDFNEKTYHMAVYLNIYTGICVVQLLDFKMLSVNE